MSLAKRLLSRRMSAIASSSSSSYYHQVSSPISSRGVMALSQHNNNFIYTSSSQLPAFVPIGWRKSNDHLRREHQSIITRLFGCNPNSPNAQPGKIFLEDDRLNNSDEDYPEESNSNNSNPILPINLNALRQTIQHTREIIGYPTYDISVTLVTDSHMREINSISRGIDAPTDVLSFCFQDEDDIDEPGKLGEVQFDLPDFYNLGDVLIDVEYIQRRCEEDRRLHLSDDATAAANNNKGGNDIVLEGEVIADHPNNDDDTRSEAGSVGMQHQRSDDDDDDDEQYEYIEVEVEEYDDRGVAPQMQHIYDPEIRIHMLLVHGMLHLVGYDHIKDDDYELMVVREDEVLAELRRRLGSNFGVPGRSLTQ
jgi:rRNA maturation RNase YbeY